MPRVSTPARALHRLLLASLTTLGACASWPGGHGFSASPPAAFSAASSSSSPAPATYEDGAFVRTRPDDHASWQDQPETDAHRDANGMVSAPGPSPISRTAPTCDAAHNHCLHGNTWFVSDLAEARARPKLAFRFDGQFFTWRNGEQLTGYDGYVAYQTAPATAANALPGTVIAAYAPDEPGALPDSAGKARTDSAWRIGKVQSVDAAAGTFRFAQGKAHPLALARIAIASQPLR